ncbi:MAG: glycoside hydrolase/phage tail family protein [Hyphomonas sp.]|nr:glycoside hydrolase/phage tail family protein [Hyphomonas sp.]
MAEIILSQAGAVAGSALLPNGIGLLGQTISGAVLGEAVGRFAGRAIDASLSPVSEGPRISALHVMESREGSALPLIYGRARVGGQAIWASRFKENRTEQSAGKGGPKYSEYSYTISFAVALCQGPITRVDRVWANGDLLTLSQLNWRLYSGTEKQLPDPLIEAVEGRGAAPAYKGTAYIVFEDFPLDAFGNHLPQLSFEVVRASQNTSDRLSESVDGVNIIPASGEFVYATSNVRERRFPGIERALNMNNARGEADFLVSLDQLGQDLPKVSQSALTVAWFGTDLRAGECRIAPGVEERDRSTVPYTWSVSSIGRDGAHLISRANTRPNYGGTPADQAVIEGIQALKAAGHLVTLSPFLLMDVPEGNGLPDPYGSAEQAPFPWRGRISVMSDQTAAAREAIASFVGEDWGNGFRHFILHHARLAVEAGGVEAFLIGSEMVGLTRVRDDQGRFPFVEALVEIAQEVREILGPGVKISYAADWTEYGAFTPPDGSGDVLFPLDLLWASENIDFVGLDWYPPMSDWRDGEEHLDALAGFEKIEDEAYLLRNLTGGEAYEWYYGSDADRGAQVRTPIEDPAHGEPWVFRQKDLANWWSRAHHERPNGLRSSQPTSWVPESKPIRLIELGVPAIDKGTNAPNLFYDPKSSESALPHFSNGGRDDLIQRRALSVANTYWRAQPMVEQVLNWAWDGRPWPDYPSREDIWGDGPNWQFGHWLNGRASLINVAEVVDDVCARAGVSVDTRDLDGVIEGVVLDSVMSVASALSPLASAYEFAFKDTGAGLSAGHEGAISVISVSSERILEDTYVATRDLLDKQASAVTLQYVSGDSSYEPAMVESRMDLPASDLKVGLTYPIVLSEGRAQTLAERRLMDLRESRSRSIALPPGEAIGLEPLDRLDLDGAEWIVDRIEEQGLQRQLRLRPARS